MSTSEQGNPAFNIYHDAKPVEPYLNPAYWNGHTLGIGEHQPFEPSVRAWRAAAFASTALRRYLSFQRPSFALQVYQSGEEFEPAAYPPGTIVKFENEELLKWEGVVWEGLDKDDFFSGMQIPNLPVVDEERTAGRPRTAVYSARPMWGVVTPAKGKRPSQLYGVNVDFDDPVHGGATLSSMMYLVKGISPIGAVQHHAIDPPSGPERLTRITQLHVLEEGSSRRRSRSRFALFGRTVAPDA